PMGVFEMEAFAQGTAGVAHAIIDATANTGSFTVVGGGDSAASVRTLSLDEARFSHISTGGSASLEFLEGKTLPDVDVLASYIVVDFRDFLTGCASNGAYPTYCCQLDDEAIPQAIYR